ncbi:hypothetical protein [Nocardioides pakistanensis]
MSTEYQPRQPKGIPIGGQFANREHSEAGLTLDGPGAARRPPASHADRLFGDAERHDALLSRGYVPPTFFAAVDDPRSTARRREWWEQHFISAEHDEQGSGYPKMPDDYTPKRTLGRALSGHRRTHRMNYTDGDVTFRMPSVTSIKRYAQETGSTFDVPVSAQDSSGRTVSGWVRVTNNGAGVWSAEGLGFTGATNAKISEAVASRLESRRPRLGAMATGDLIERHRARLAAQGATMEPVRSKWISAVGYNSDAGVMVTQTSNGNVYGHHVDADTFAAVRGSASPGATFNSLVKGHGGAQVSNCAKCGRFFAEENGHLCPVAPKAPAPGPKPVNLEQRRAAQQIAEARQRVRQFTPPPGLAARMPGGTPRPSSGTGDADPKGSSGAGRAPGVPHRRDPEAMTSRLGSQFDGALGADMTDPHRPMIFGPERGFTRDAVDTLEPFTSQTYVSWAYQPKFGEPGEFYRNDLGNPMFAGVSGPAARALLDSLPEENLAVRQADGAPSLRSALRAAAEHPDLIEVHGYAVLPHRSDERVTAEGVHLYDTDGSLDSPGDIYARMRDLGLDAAGTADEISLEQTPWRPGERAWRVWWD